MDTITKQEHQSLLDALRARGFSRPAAQQWLTAKAVELGHIDSMQIYVEEMAGILEDIAEATP
jgi:hypothetical protein